MTGGKAGRGSSHETSLVLEFGGGTLMVQFEEEGSLSFVATGPDEESVPTIGKADGDVAVYMCVRSMTNDEGIWQRRQAIDCIDQLATFLALWVRRRRDDLDREE